MSDYFRFCDPKDYQECCNVEAYQRVKTYNRSLPKSIAIQSLTKPANRATLLVGLRLWVRNIDAVENV